MATRSRIGILNPDGTVTSIYCHFDGYPEGVGRTLIRHYDTEEKARALLALGDLSSLGERLAPTDGVSHSFDDPAEGVTVAYGRDRGEPDTAAKTHAADAWPDSWQEYEYVYDDIYGWTINEKR